MTPTLLRLVTLLVMAVPATAHTDELFTITTTSHVALGDEGGDTFGMEQAAAGQVTILLNPAGENCTLRFPLRKGETFQLRVRAGIDQTLGCEVALNETGKGMSATFVSRCVETPMFGPARCPAEP